MRMKLAFGAGYLALAMTGPAAASDCGSLDSLRWLLGDWRAEGGATTLHESWRAAGPRTFEGVGTERAAGDGAVKGEETLRLVEMSDSVFYVAKVAHNELPVAFRLNQCGDGRFVFANPAHDFPRRIEYRQEQDDRLSVHVSDGAAKGFTLEFARNAVPAGPAADPAAAVLAAEDARFAAMTAADPEAMRRWIADDLWYVHSSGQVDTQNGLIESIVKKRLRYIAVAPIKRQVVLADSGTAYVTGHGLFTVAAGRAELNLELRYLAIYGRAQAGDWRLRAWQSLRLL
jgi:hypothetical protein